MKEVSNEYGGDTTLNTYEFNKLVQQRIWKRHGVLI